ncbi:ribosomal protein S3 family protein [Actinidia rufa]|uniref:Ribosomal protein S3 family protein n=1 Tax=Actinidia rufa TaxID=165716 RepID=A0A7J0DWM2_9ERIC|nr:ribosomal protein S3 family protein [Actinidia rufa]
MATQMSKKRMFVADGVFFAELNEVLTRELAEDGYSGVEVRGALCTSSSVASLFGVYGVILLSTGTSEWILWLKCLWFNMVIVPSYFKACYGVLRFIMESGAKLRAQRAKSMKFKDVYMIISGHPVNEYIDSQVRRVLLRQGVLGIKVKTCLIGIPRGSRVQPPLPDVVTIHTPKEKEEYTRPPLIAAEINVPMV